METSAAILVLAVPMMIHFLIGACSAVADLKAEHMLDQIRRRIES